MKKTLILFALVAAMPLTMNAQDDMYFVPTKKNVEKSKKNFGMPKDTYYSGSNRSIDDYNRRNRTECWEGDLCNGSQVVAIDSLGNEIATAKVKNRKARRDSLMNDDDFKYTRRMEMWDGYQCSNAYWHGYNDGRFNRWYGWSTFYDPWYYSSWYGPYGHWYDPWYDPWYYGYAGWYGNWYGGWYGGWYGSWRPYYYDWGWHGHYYPVYGGGGGSKYYGTGRAGTANHGSGSYGRPASAFGSGRSISSGIANRDRTNSVITRSGTSNRYNSNRNVSYQRNNINTSSSRNQSFNNSSSTRGSSVSSGSSFGGGSRGGGGISAGGSRSGGSIGHGGRR